MKAPRHACAEDLILLVIPVTSLMLILALVEPSVRAFFQQNAEMVVLGLVGALAGLVSYVCMDIQDGERSE